MTSFSHLNEHGEASMVDVSAKSESARDAVAVAVVSMRESTLNQLVGGDLPKGDALSVARVAGIQAAKKTSELIPLCHPLPITNVAVNFKRIGPDRLEIRSACSVTGRTGVEMEAMTAASVAALTVYDMCKSVEKGISIESIRLLAKTGGKSGTWCAENDD